MTIDERMAELQQQRQRPLEAGGTDRVAKQHAAGKLTARERVALLLDPGSFTEQDMLVTHRCRDFGMDKQTIPGEIGRAHV